MEAILHPIPRKYLERMNEPDKGHVKAALQRLEEEPPKGNIKPLAGQPGTFRLTIGSYRAIFRYGEEHILVTHLDPRGQAYKKKNKGKKR
ncbi:MAG: type II toxin-antitoxin system RelE/ParE family toxin [Spirochaetes bacterium]|nr:type II toxin-antitoxin system RelE/ParE family toxin [Spirochaetota bacterium]